MIVIPGLQARTAKGQTGANQFLGQVEAGYRIGIYEPAAASLTPFARFQGVEQQPGRLHRDRRQLAQPQRGAADDQLGAQHARRRARRRLRRGWREKLALQFRLGWAHEYANTARPVTAAFAGAPGANFTVFGAAPQRDAAVIGLAANTAIAESTSLYLRYDGE